jgi:hypothetical protein
MVKKTFADLEAHEFESLLENMVSEDYEQLTSEEFFGAWSAINADRARQRLELTGEVRGDQLVLDAHSLVPVHGNEIHLGEWTIVIHLRPTVETLPTVTAPLP